MNDLRETRGLIMDLRGNGGGGRAPLRTLFPFFMRANDPPHIVNVAAYRTGIGRREADLRFELRFLYPVDWEHWTAEERAVVEAHAQTFTPEWSLSAGQFSEWHYFVISPTADDRYYFYERPVVILMESRNFSACDIFLGAFKGWRNVTLLGMPSGGGSGSANGYRLRHSKIEVKLSTMASFRANGLLYEDRGIEPDAICEPAATDWIGQTDTVFERALRLFQ